MSELRFCPCGFSFMRWDTSDPMAWHREVGIHQARIERQRLEMNEANIEAAVRARETGESR